MRRCFLAALHEPAVAGAWQLCRDAPHSRLIRGAHALLSQRAIVSSSSSSSSGPSASSATGEEAHRAPSGSTEGAFSDAYDDTGPTHECELPPIGIFGAPGLEQRCVVIRNLPSKMFGTEIRAFVMRLLGRSESHKQASAEDPFDVIRDAAGALDGHPSGSADGGAGPSTNAAAAGEGEGGDAEGEDVLENSIQLAAEDSRRFVERVFVPLTAKRRRARPVCFVLMRDPADAAQVIRAPAEAALDELGSSLGVLRGPLEITLYKKPERQKSPAQLEMEDLQTTLRTLELDRVLMNPNILFDFKRKHQRRYVVPSDVVQPAFFPPQGVGSGAAAAAAAAAAATGPGAWAGADGAEFEVLREVEAMQRPGQVRMRPVKD